MASSHEIELIISKLNKSFKSNRNNFIFYEEVDCIF